MDKNKNEEDEKNQSSVFKAIIDDLDVSEIRQLVSDKYCHFKYELDDFQVRSMYRIEQNESVFVSAPTSAGKTAIAEYALWYCKARGKLAIYTSPLKALSNQKFRNFSQKFGEVGILTGDITINREAPILIMTTEILRSMLYKNDEILSKIGYVIFDEFHYILDKERGNAWEESIIQMPQHVKMVFLSATIPNIKEIGNWISTNKKRSVFLEIHDKRPVPVYHYIYGSGKLYPIYNEEHQLIQRSTFEEARIQYDKQWWNDSIEISQYWNKFITNLSEEKMLPALVFNFSSDKIENYAQMADKVDLLSPDEKKYVNAFFKKALDKLPKEDQKLPQIIMMKGLIDRGIGIHYGGIIPILREVVEILLSDGFLKVVFCTSSFEMGINVPVRTCCFTTTMKFNGENIAPLTHEEYMQMSGRAGRRGLDDAGFSLIMATEEFPDYGDISRLFHGSSEKTKSSFHIDFDMIFNSIRKGMHMVDIVRQSLLVTSQQEGLEGIKEKSNALMKELSELPRIENCPEMAKNESDDIEDIEAASPVHRFVDSINVFNDTNNNIISFDFNNFLYNSKEGVVVLLTNSEFFQIGVIESVAEQDSVDSVNDIPKILTVFLSSGVRYSIKNTADLICMHHLTPPLQKILMDDDETKKKKLAAFLIHKSNPYHKLFKKNDLKFVKFSEKHQTQLLNFSSSPCFNCDSLPLHYKTSTLMRKLRKMIDFYSNRIDNQKGQIDEELIDHHFAMLKEMGYIKGEKDNEVLDVKGEIAADLAYADKIVATEILYNHIFDDCTPQEIAALCSCLVADRKGGWQNQKNYNPKLHTKMDEILRLLKSIEEQMTKNKVPFNRAKFADKNMNPAVLYSVYLWASGKSFVEVMNDEKKIKDGYMLYIFGKDYKLLLNLQEAANKIGMCEVAEKFENAAKLIERYNVFAGNLYFD